MEYRRLTQSDFDACYALRLRGLKEAPTAFLSTYEEEARDGGALLKLALSSTGEENVVFGALDGARLVGMSGIYRERGSRVRHKGFIWGVYVDASHRGRGIAGRLLDRCIDHAKGLGLRVVGLTVKGGGVPARKLYDSRGFKTWGVEPLGTDFGGEFYSEEHMSFLIQTQ